MSAFKKPVGKKFHKEIGWILLIKLVLIIAIRMIFFSHPLPKPDRMDLTAAHLLGATASAPHSSLTENRRSYDQ
ncbi:MAG: hypothetical protein H6R07_1282 [Proteobacteria bacterium]|nr:hypothetical protein [Pseudomonadota bacterium]